MSIDGIDVSQYQGEIDMAQVGEAGKTWIAIRATRRPTSADPGLLDTRFQSNWAGARASGIPYRLAYHWLRASENPVVQALRFTRQVGVLQTNEGMMLDAEEPELTADALFRFRDTVEAYTGRPIAVYVGGPGGASGSKVRLLGTGVGSGRPLIWPAYRPVESAAADYTSWTGQRWPPSAWQSSSTGTCPGIVGSVDLDVIFAAHDFDACCGRSWPLP